MEPFATELLALLGKSSSSAEVRAFVERFGLVDVYDDPPFRRYIGSNARGIDLLFESERLLAIQIYSRPTQGFLAFSQPLPFGLKSEMRQEQVHSLLGAPAEADANDSKFVFASNNARLAVNYMQSGTILYLNIGATRGQEQAN